MADLVQCEVCGEFCHGIDGKKRCLKHRPEEGKPKKKEKPN